MTLHGPAWELFLVPTSEPPVTIPCSWTFLLENLAVLVVERPHGSKQRKSLPSDGAIGQLAPRATLEPHHKSETIA
jgi:hypothetical protein